jgi:inorganic pyrophosphatase
LVFPFDFGFIPSTIAEDGDPEDVLLLLEEPITASVVVPARLVGVIEAVQQEKTGKSERNDRLIAVAPACQLYAHIETLSDLPKEVLDQVQHFFVTYNAEEGNQFIPQGQHGPKRALKCLEKSQRRYARKHKQK